MIESQCKKELQRLSNTTSHLLEHRITSFHNIRPMLSFPGIAQPQFHGYSVPTLKSLASHLPENKSLLGILPNTEIKSSSVILNP